jgi:DNA-binding response OmpR family regulator
MKILLLEDDTILADSLAEYLELEGFEVDIAYNAQEAYNFTFHNNYDLYIFDINLADENGFEVLKNLQNADDTTPTIYISALVDIETISKAFNIGAVDYIKKPFDPEELVLRIKTRFRSNDKVLTYKDITYNPDTKEIYKGNERVILSDLQLNIFDILIKNKNHLVPTYELLDFLENPNSNALRVAINKLKKKLDLNLKNVRAKGYILEEV